MKTNEYGLFTAIAMIVGAIGIKEIIPQFAAEHTCAWQIRQNHTKCDGQKQQRLKALLDGQIQKIATYGNHDEILPTFANEEVDEAHLTEELVQALFHIKCHSRCCHEQHQGNE